ncbi:MAG: transferrin receptor-like dimerization domain-containing protein [Planctomycetota bacterium]
MARASGRTVSAETGALLGGLADRARTLEAKLREREAASTLSGRARDRVLIALDRVWIDEDGLPGRTWYRNLYAAPDENSGYAAWMLPGLRRAVELGDENAMRAEARRLAAALDRLDRLSAPLSAPEENAR